MPSPLGKVQVKSQDKFQVLHGKSKSSVKPISQVVQGKDKSDLQSSSYIL